MNWVNGAELTAAVSNAGGLGTLGTGNPLRAAERCIEFKILQAPNPGFATDMLQDSSGGKGVFCVASSGWASILGYHPSPSGDGRHPESSHQGLPRQSPTRSDCRCYRSRG